MQIHEISAQHDLPLITTNQDSFLQSWAWREVQESFGRKARSFVIQDQNKPVGFFTVFHHQVSFCRYLYLPRGPVFASELDDAMKKKALTAVFETLKSEGKKMNMHFVRIEPPFEKNVQNDFETSALNVFSSCRRVPFVQPSDTLLLDLTKTADEILADMHVKTRYNIKLAQKKNLEVKSINENSFSDFWNLLAETSQRQGIKIHPREYYEKIFACGQKDSEFHVQCLVIFHEKEAAAAGMFICYRGTASYLHGGSDRKFRQLKAPHLLQWVAIQEAQKQGCRVYDFFGISPSAEDATHSLSDVSKFKRGFGGEEKHYLGTYELVIDPKKYHLYRAAKRLRSFLR